MWAPGSGDERTFEFSLGHGQGDEDSDASTFSWNTDESDARNLNVEVDGDQMKVTGEDKDGKPFTIEGTKDEVHQQLKEMGINVHVLAMDHKAPMAFGMGSNGQCPAMAFGMAGDNSNCKNLNIEINGDQYHVTGETNEGEKFDASGTREEVHEALAAKGINVDELHNQLMAGHGGAMAFAAPELARELRIEMPEINLGGAIGMVGATMTPEAKAEAQKKVAELTAKANSLFEAGKNGEAIAVLQEAWGQSLMLSIGGDSEVIQKIIINGDDDENAGGGAGHRIVIRKEVKGDHADASAPAPDRESAESDRITQ
ncbi:MAG: hypothetical protein ABI743_05685 [bacterium]